ncbi:MAG: hypothetical protein QF515_07320 [Pseudomonadales bacterium]|jgi:hypothetical protein|nr:hypothetical protein [Pseudomonadales bacterium]MDP6470007.1 hypothetical protein [Pseudomonadales bacterium]MDP6826907.1 hypothetical protein [Pseudomonadales bacterium]|tara:strand:- start:3 stop:248 length:246 start_codon:yes stop_codon:yes gene_type:complete
MYILDPAKKTDRVRRWNLPDRIFFGHGACHILAGTYLELYHDAGFQPFCIRPSPSFPGNHIFVRNGVIAFDHRRLLAPHTA